MGTINISKLAPDEALPAGIVLGYCDIMRRHFFDPCIYRRGCFSTIMKAILKNLKDQILSDDRAMMYCTKCGGEYSANAGDYFMVSDPEYRFKCCGRTMELVIKTTNYESITS
jgi:hypothetical protein